MAKVRLFANLREIAGAGRVELPGQRVSEVLDEATERFGPSFAAGLQTSRVWVNGAEALPEDPVGSEDEVVILPPVSGGSQPAAVSTVDLIGFLPLIVAIVVIVANTQGQEVWAAALVAAASAWAMDIGAAFDARGRSFSPIAVVTTAAAGAVAAHTLGGFGYALTVALAVAICMGWAVAFPAYRGVDVFSPTFLAGLLAGLASASLVLARAAGSPDPRAVDVFLVAMVAGVLVGAVVARMPAVPYLDPITTTAIVAVLGAVGAALLFDLDVVGYLLVGLGLAVSLVAGNGLSSMLRTGRVALTQRPPGFVPSMDGVVLAAAIYFPLIGVVL